MKLEQCKEGMEITKGSVNNHDLCCEIIGVWDDCITVKELAWVEGISAYRTNGITRLVKPEELSEYKAY